MGSNQNANWGVTTDWVDKMVGTRIKYNDRKTSDPMIQIRK